jgi:glutamate racemase
LVQEIERGELDGRRTRIILETALRPMLDEGIDTVVLGCTHYPFVIPLIQEIVGQDVRVIDPAPAIARQVTRLLDSARIRAEGLKSKPLLFFTSGKITQFKALLPRLINETGRVQKAFWESDNIHV